MKKYEVSLLKVLTHWPHGDILSSMKAITTKEGVKMDKEKRLNVRLTLVASEVDRYETLKVYHNTHEDVYLAGLRALEKRHGVKA